MIKRLLILGIILFIGCKPPEPTLKTLTPKSQAELREFFHYRPGRSPLVSAHRGGPVDGFPENCLATFEHTLGQTYALIECDVRLTNDGELMFLHDRKLDRTTTGTGEFSSHSKAEIRALKLKDEKGALTPYGSPTLKEVLDWARNKTIIMLDIKGVPPERIVSELQQQNARSYVVVITYNATEAQNYLKLDSTLIMSCNIEKIEDYDRLISVGMKPENIVAFCGITEPDKSLYEFLHSKGIMCQLGTLGNLDKRAEARGDQIYLEYLKNGADVLATDRPAEVWEIVKQYNRANRIQDIYIQYQ